MQISLAEFIRPARGGSRLIEKHSPARLSISGADKSRIGKVAAVVPPIPVMPAIGCSGRLRNHSIGLQLATYRRKLGTAQPLYRRCTRI